MVEHYEKRALKIYFKKRKEDIFSIFFLFSYVWFS